MVNLIGNFSRLDRKNVLVAGDLMLDSYTIGKTSRTSPEAPVVVVEVLKKEERAGGAGNAILNLVSMGAHVTALGRIGNDSAGKMLLNSLAKEGVNTQGIIVEDGHMTPIKNRIVADGQQIVRVDHEILTSLEKKTEEIILKKLPKLLEGIHAVAISDYGKGFLSPRLLSELIAYARAKNIFVIADPKGDDYSRYRNVNLIKPNIKEAYQAAQLDVKAPLSEAANRILARTQAEYLMITRSEDGISLYQLGKEPIDFPVQVKEVKDVTGAGDTVLAMLTLSIANNLSLPIAIHFSNVAASIAIEQFGCARVTLPQLAKRLLNIDSTNKVFDSAHLHALQAVLKDHPCSLIALEFSPTIEMISQLAKYKKETGHLILTTIQNATDENLVGMLAALHPVDFVLLNTEIKKIKELLPTITSLDKIIQEPKFLKPQK